MSTFCCSDWNLALAKRTNFRCRCCRRCFLIMYHFGWKCIHRFHEAEYNKGHNQEIDDRRQEFSIFQCNITHDVQRQLIEIQTSEYPQNRWEDIVYQRCDNGRKSASNDNTDCHIHHIAAADKFLKLVNKTFTLSHFFPPLNIVTAARNTGRPCLTF